MPMSATQRTVLLAATAILLATQPSRAMESLRGILESARALLPSGPAAPPASTPGTEGPAAADVPTATPTPSPAPAAPKAYVPSPKSQPPVVRVNVASQASSFTQPWRKNTRTLRQGLGVVLMDGRILVTAELVGNHTYVELEKPETALKAQAKVEVVDYDANLALLAAPAAEFLQSVPGARLDESAAVGDRIEIMQLESNGRPVITPATITTIEVGSYPVDENAFLVFKLSVPLQSRENSFTVPAFKDGRLIGLVMRYQPMTQTADVVPAPVIEHFLQAVDHPPYAGFPRAGLTFSDTRDPQLRRYAKLPDGKGGAYVTKVVPGSPAAGAGIKVGDVLLSVDGFAIDQDGNYEDARFGKISLAHYVSTVLQAGQKIPIVVWRDGAETTLEGVVAPRDRAQMISQPYIFDREPDYVVAGGIVFSELSRQFLREWGSNWSEDAPLHLVYLDRFQGEAPEGRHRIVFISDVLSGPNSIGYDDLRFEVVDEVNGKKIGSLKDLADALDHPTDNFQRIKLAEDPGTVILDVEGTKAEEARIMSDYSVPAPRRLESQN